MSQLTTHCFYRAMSKATYCTMTSHPHQCIRQELLEMLVEVGVTPKVWVLQRKVKGLQLICFLIIFVQFVQFFYSTCIGFGSCFHILTWFDSAIRILFSLPQVLSYLIKNKGIGWSTAHHIFHHPRKSDSFHTQRVVLWMVRTSSVSPTPWIASRQ